MKQKVGKKMDGKINGLINGKLKQYDSFEEAFNDIVKVCQQQENVINRMKSTIDYDTKLINKMREKADSPCKACGNPIEHDYCEHCLELWARQSMGKEAERDTK